LASGLIYRTPFRILTAGLLVVAACDIPRDNPLDPKNPKGNRPKKILIEAFVNLNTGFPFDGYMLGALDSIESIYPGRVIIAEYHRNVQNAQSPYTRAENEILYQHYVNAFQPVMKAAPDVFFNGTQARVQGASSQDAAFFRLQEALIGLVSENGQFSIQIETSLSGTRLTPTATLARLGDTDAEDLLVKAIAVSRIAAPNLTRVVVSDVERKEIDILKHGEIQTIEFEAMTVDPSFSVDLIVILCDKGENTVFHCEKKRVITP
jgi:hypothetical protein